jgi:predicted protein tyrosine phosphatase
MRILCVCSQGNKRSVFTRQALNHLHDVLSIGVDTNDQDTIDMLAKWADIILLAEPEMQISIPIGYQPKIDHKFTIGPDIYPVSIKGKLMKIVNRKLKELGYI